MFLSTSIMLSINPDASFPQMQARQLTQMDDTSVMCLFDSQAEADKNSKIGLPWYLYVNIHSFREIVVTQPTIHSVQSVTFKYLPAIFIPLAVYLIGCHQSDALSFLQKICHEHQAGFPLVQTGRSRADSSSCFSFHPDLYSLLFNLVFSCYARRRGLATYMYNVYACARDSKRKNVFLISTYSSC